MLTSTAEYRSNYIIYLQVQKRLGITIEVVPNAVYGQVDIAALRQMLDERIKLITITHVPTSNGQINPAAEIGKASVHYYNSEEEVEHFVQTIERLL